jgi:RHS repeat-associated protein
MAGISCKATGGVENKKKFNRGTELNTDFEINFYETNFRSLDPQVGRFWQIDPMSDAAYEFSPYSYANSNPITFTDPLGLISDSLHPVNLQEVTVTSKAKVSNSFLPYIKFPHQRGYSIASSNDRPFSFSKNRSNDMVDSWKFGLGAENRVYLPNHWMTKKLKNAYQVNKIRAQFYKKYYTDYKNGLSLVGKELVNQPGEFGITGIIMAGGDLAEQFVGGFLLDIHVDEKGENLLFVINNTTGNHSAYYHMTTDIQKTPGVTTPEGNFNQKYIWKEPISNAAFINAHIESNWNNAHVVK